MDEMSTSSNTTTQIKLIRKFLKLKILEDNVSFRGHNLEREHVYNLMKGAVLHGESHSAIMIGPRGSGKTTLINSVLHQLSKEADLVNDAVIVKLNGFVHYDDKLALKSITAQMQLENAVGDRVFGTFAENLSFLLSCLMSGTDRRCKSMVFILEEMDMFCHSGHTQTLLYNLFDITHSKLAPICVLGVTNRIDVIELLEKRVKSRFSHRNIFIFPNEESSDNNMDFKQLSPLETFKNVLLDLLSLPTCEKRTHSPKKKGRPRKKSTGNLQETMDIDIPNLKKHSIPEEVLLKCKLNPDHFYKLDPTFIDTWNSHITSLVQDERVIDAIEKFSYYCVNEQIFRNVLFQVVSKLSTTRPYIDATDLIRTIDSTVAPEHRVKLLQSLSILELSLVIAMKHGMDIFDGQPMNFEMILHRYTKFANTNSSTQTVPRPVILKAFEHLQALEIIMPVRSSDSIYAASETTASRVQKEYQLYTLSVPIDDIQEAVKGFKALPTEINHWFSNSVV